MISAALVKELRQRTGAGMMECKKALVESNGDIDSAIENMRKSGLAKADKKAGRIAAEGRIGIEQVGNSAAMAEVNCETDFVANGKDFASFVVDVTHAALISKSSDAKKLGDFTLGDAASVDTIRRELVARVGENISVRRCVFIKTDNGILGSYNHGFRIGVLVELQGGDADLAKGIAMHIAACRPLYIKSDDVPASILEKERDIIRAQSSADNKPQTIIDKMVEGRLRKYLAEITLLGQSFVKNTEITVEKLLVQSGAEVLRFARFEVGEGIEKRQDNFAAEVMAQARGD